MSGPRLSAARFSWRKLSAAKWGDAWLERLSFLGPQRVMVIELAGSRTARVEAHGLTKSEGNKLVRSFGGALKEARRLTAVDPPDRAPVRIRGRLLIFSREGEMERHRNQSATTPAILIPAGMAFGTGEHATTATCLRLLVDVSRKFAPGSWEQLDLGTGSGILAIAGRKLGARRVDAGDFDSLAVRTAKENARANQVDRVKIQRLDVRPWKPERTWEIVSANLFSDLLIEVARKIAKAVAPGGALIFSGILRMQEAEVVAALEKAGLRVERVTRKGKWVSGVARRAG